MLYVSRARFVLYAGSGGNCTYAMNSTYGGVVQIDQGGVYFLPLRLMAPAVYTLCHVFAQQFHFEVCRMTPQMPPPARPPMPREARPLHPRRPRHLCCRPRRRRPRRRRPRRRRPRRRRPRRRRPRRRPRRRRPRRRRPPRRSHQSNRTHQHFPLVPPPLRPALAALPAVAPVRAAAPVPAAAVHPALRPAAPTLSTALDSSAALPAVHSAAPALASAMRATPAPYDRL